MSIDLQVTNKNDLNELLDFIIDNELDKNISKLCKERKQKRKELKDSIVRKATKSFNSIQKKPSTKEQEILNVIKPNWLVSRHIENKWLILNPKSGKYCYLTYKPNKSKNIRWKISNGVVIKRLDLDRTDIVACFKQSPSFYSEE